MTCNDVASLHHKTPLKCITLLHFVYSVGSQTICFRSLLIYESSIPKMHCNFFTTIITFKTSIPLLTFFSWQYNADSISARSEQLSYCAFSDFISSLH